MDIFPNFRGVIIKTYYETTQFPLGPQTAPPFHHPPLPPPVCLGWAELPHESIRLRFLQLGCTHGDLEMDRAYQ